MVQPLGSQCALAAPLRRGGRLLGVLSLRWSARAAPRDSRTLAARPEWAQLAGFAAASLLTPAPAPPPAGIPAGGRSSDLGGPLATAGAALAALADAGSLAELVAAVQQALTGHVAGAYLLEPCGVHVALVGPAASSPPAGEPGGAAGASPPRPRHTLFLLSEGEGRGPRSAAPQANGGATAPGQATQVRRAACALCSPRTCPPSPPSPPACAACARIPESSPRTPRWQSSMPSRVRCIQSWVLAPAPSCASRAGAGVAAGLGPPHGAGRAAHGRHAARAAARA
jgi:hypothetical protein